MKLSISKKDLLSALEQCAQVVEKSSAAPILSNVRLETMCGGLSVFAASLTQSLAIELSADIGQDGAVLVRATVAKDRIASMPDGQLLISGDASGLTIKSDSSKRKIQLPALDADDFPKLGEPEGGASTLDIDAEQLESVMRPALYAVSADDTRPALNSLLFEVSPGIVRCVATDGHRLHKAELRLENESTFTSLVPFKAAHNILRILPKAGSVRLVSSGNQLFVSCGGARLGVRLVDAQFPPYEQVIPKLTESALVQSASLSSSLKALAGSSKDGGLKLSIGLEAIELEAQSPDNGEASDSIDAKSNGELMCGVNSSYAVQAIVACGSESVSVAFGGELDPLLFTPADTTGQLDVLCVVMPVRI